MAWGFPVLKAVWSVIKLTGKLYHWAFTKPAAGILLGSGLWLLGRLPAAQRLPNQGMLLRKVGGSLVVYSAIGYGLGESRNKLARALWNTLHGKATTVPAVSIEQRRLWAGTGITPVPFRTLYPTPLQQTYADLKAWVANVFR